MIVQTNEWPYYELYTTVIARGQYYGILSRYRSFPEVLLALEEKTGRKLEGLRPLAIVSQVRLTNADADFLVDNGVPQIIVE